MRSLINLLTRNYILLANLGCLIGFCFQFGNVLDTYVHPTQTTITVTERDLKDSEFPLLFKICFNPSFNTTAEEEAGFDDFFSGQSKYNSSLVGWAGHTEEGGVLGTVEEMVSKLTLHNPQEVIDAIWVWSMANEWINISIESVQLWRLNDPYNCFTLNLSKNEEVSRLGVKQVFFFFPLMENSSMELLLKGASTICSREIKAHKFYSSGTDIQFTTSSRRLDGGAYCGAPVGGKCMVSKAKLVLYAFAV